MELEHSELILSKTLKQLASMEPLGNSPYAMQQGQGYKCISSPKGHSALLVDDECDLEADRFLEA